MRNAEINCGSIQVANHIENGCFEKENNMIKDLVEHAEKIGFKVTRQDSISSYQLGIPIKINF